MRVWVWVSVAMLGMGVGGAQEMKPMPVDAKPVFEVSTVKPTDPAEQSQGFQTRGRHIKVLNESVTSMIMFAYGVHQKQIVNGPEWMKQRFDVDGVPDVVGEPNLKQLQNMLQVMLADRFGLKFHREKKELAVYALSAVKGGVKLEKSKSPEDAMPDQTGNGSAHKQTMRFTNNSMDEFSLGMQYFLDKPVLNATGLTGKYDFTLTWNPGLAPDDAEAEAPGLFTATREQLGLKLEATRGLVDVIVVDALSKPTAD